MNRMIQIRNVPPEIHSRLKSRAALAGQSLSDYLLAELLLVIERPTPQEMLHRLSQRTPVRMRSSAAAALRRERSRR